MPIPYAELHCLSNFSFQRGASHPEELVERAAALDYAAIAITDECSLAGVVRAHRALQDMPVRGRPKLIIGSEFQLADGPHVVLLAANRRGYGQLSRLITQARRAADKGYYHIDREMLEADPAQRLDDCLPCSCHHRIFHPCMGWTRRRQRSPLTRAGWASCFPAAAGSS